MIEIIYKCRCMKAEATFSVRFRGKHEDIADWMRDMQKAMGADHLKRSPLCMATKVEYAKFAVPENTDGIGRPPVLNS